MESVIPDRNWIWKVMSNKTKKKWSGNPRAVLARKNKVIVLSFGVLFTSIVALLRRCSCDPILSFSEEKTSGYKTRGQDSHFQPFFFHKIFVIQTIDSVQCSRGSKGHYWAWGKWDLVNMFINWIVVVSPLIGNLPGLLIDWLIKHFIILVCFLILR